MILVVDRQHCFLCFLQGMDTSSIVKLSFVKNCNVELTERDTDVLNILSAVVAKVTLSVYLLHFVVKSDRLRPIHLMLLLFVTPLVYFLKQSNLPLKTLYC